MAQDFERFGQHAVGTSATAVFTSDSDDAIISVRLANTTTSTINASVFIGSTTSGSSQNHYLIKDAPIVSGGSLELIDGGSKIVLHEVAFALARSG